MRNQGARQQCGIASGAPTDSAGGRKKGRPHVCFLPGVMMAKVEAGCTGGCFPRPETECQHPASLCPVELRGGGRHRAGMEGAEQRSSLTEAL